MQPLQHLLGIGAQNVNWYQAALRAVIIYCATLLMVRIGEKRFLGKNTPFDIIVGIILGSMVSSAINALDNILPTLVAGFVLVAMHSLFAYTTYKSDWLDTFLKGTSHQLIDNGEILWDSMKKNDLTKADLVQEMRTVGKTEDLNRIKKAYFERSGDISFIKSGPKLNILEVKVEDGVQTVRIILES